MEDKDIKLGTLYRTVTVDTAALATRAEGDDSIPLAISSEAPVDRWFGREILSHDAAAVDLTYARGGLPLLMDHDTSTQIGIVRAVGVGKDGVLRGRAEFGNHPDAAWVRKDMLAGIRPNVSVGYRVNSMKLSATDAERGDEYTVDSWTPMEVSTVPVPADISVGVGRGADDGVRPVAVKGTVEPAQPEREGRMSDEAPATVPGTKGPSFDELRKEVAGIYALGAEHGCMDKAAAAVERGISRDRFAAEILEMKRAEHAAKPTVGVDMSEKEHKQYSVQRAIFAKSTGDWRTAGLEMEVHKALKSTLADQSRDGVMIPWNTRASVTGNIAGTSSLGGAAVATEMRELIDLLRNRVVVVQAGATQLFGLTSNLSYPRQITPTSAAWVGENPSSANTLTASTFDNVLLSPKTAMVSTAFSRQMLIQSSFDANAVIMNDIAQVNAIALDYAALNGVGSSNQPTGIRVQSGITNKTLGTNGANLAWADIVSTETSVATANADIGAIKWLVTPGTRGKLKTTLQNTTSGAAYIFGSDDRLNGYPALVTNQLPTNLTKGTSTTICHSALFGVWSDLLLGVFGGGLELIVDPFSVAGQNMIAVHSVLLADVAVRHPAAFVKIDDILVT